MRYPVATFGWDHVKLSSHSFEDLNRLRLAVQDDPASANPAHASGKSIYLHTSAARRKLDAIAWAVTTKLHEQRAAAQAEA